MRGSYRDDPRLRSIIFDLLDVVFPGIKRHAARVAAISDCTGGEPMRDDGKVAPASDYPETEWIGSRRGGDPMRSPIIPALRRLRWEDVSTPFVEIDKGQVIAHVGLIEIPMVISGRETIVASIHAVATDPTRRRQGLFRRVMEEALLFCEGRIETQVLTTEHPEYFEPFGFRYVQEHRFACSLHHGPRARIRSGEDRDGFRPLQLIEEDDLRKLFILLEERTPVSHVVGVVREMAIFSFNEIHRPMYYSPELDVVLCSSIDGNVLCIYDIVGRRIPELGSIIDRFPYPVEEALIHFSPDRMGVSTTQEPYLLDHDGPSYLMVRGALSAEHEGFTLPRSART